VTGSAAGWTPTPSPAPLLELDRARIVALEPDPVRAELTGRDREAAIDLAGEAQHLVRIIDDGGPS
jgi:hypothetical protein